MKITLTRFFDQKPVICESVINMHYVGGLGKRPFKEWIVTNPKNGKQGVFTTTQLLNITTDNEQG